MAVCWAVVTLPKGQKWDNFRGKQWPEGISVRGDGEKPLPHLSALCHTLHLSSPFASKSFCSPRALHYFDLALLGALMDEGSMWSALEQRCPSSSCFALIVLLALCLGIHLLHLSGCWKVAFSLIFFFQLILVCFITCPLSKEVINNTAVPAEKLGLIFFFFILTK